MVIKKTATVNDSSALVDEGQANQNKSDVIEIPIGRYVKAVRSNPWIVSTLFLIVVVIILGILLFRGTSPGTVTGNVVSEDLAVQNLLSFIDSQGKGSATLVSAEQEGSLYNVVVNFNGQDIPVFVTLDGKYLISDVIPLSAGSNPSSPSDSNTATAQQQAPVLVELGNSPRKGNKNASVILVEFTDYECPFCGRFYQDAYMQIIKDYVDTGNVLFVVKEFPLSIHSNAQKAAEAAHCVREQKGDAGYFKMHDLLFQNQEALSIENYKKWARQIGVNGGKFDSCLDSGNYTEIVQADLAYGQQLGVSGTPSFFINGFSLEGAQPYSAFKKIIDDELAGQ